MNAHGTAAGMLPAVFLLCGNPYQIHAFFVIYY